MPLDILQELEEQTKSVNDDALSASFEAMKEKAGASSEVMSVLQSIVDSMAESSENLHGKLSKIIRDFETYDKIVSQSVGTNRELSESWKDFGVSGVNGIQSVNRGLTTSISLMRSVQSEIDKYHQAFSKIEKAVGQMKMPRFEPMAPFPTLGSIPSHATESTSSLSSGYAKGPGPLQSFRRGGRVRGTSFTGDKNIVRVNSGEWIFTAKQMKNLARLTESRSPAEVFAKAGGNPSIKRYDGQGIQMFATGGTLGSLHREYYDKLFSSFGMHASDAYKSAKSSDERDKIEEIARLVKRIPAHLDELSEEDFKLDPDLQKTEEKLIKAFEDFEKNGLRDPAVFQDIFNKYQDTVNKKAAKAQQQNQQNQQNQGNIDKMFPNLTGHAKEFAKTLSDLNQTVKSSGSTKTMKENARNEMASVKEMLELAQKKNLTREQMIQREDIIQRYNKATSIDEKNQIAAEAHEGGQLSLSDMDRSIGAVDAATIKFNKSSEAMVESWKSFLGGTPTGLFAVGVAIGFAGKQLAGFMNNISGSVENLAKLSLQTGALKTNMDSVFGKGTFNYFRESLNLTREEMASLGPTLKDSFRSAGIEMEAMRATAENIKDAFGTMDPSKFQEALGVLGELTGEQQKTLISGGGSTSDIEGMYANLMAAGKSGQAADLIEQGVFGGEEVNPNLSEGDKEIVKAIQDMKVVNEDISMSLKDSAKGVLPTLLKYGKFVAMAIPIATSISQILVTAKAMKMMIGPLKDKFNGFKIPLPVQLPPSGSGQNGINLNPNGGSNSTTTGGGGNVGLGGKIGGMIKQSIGPGMIVGAVSTVVAEGFSMLSEHLEKKARINEIKKENDYRKTFNETGYVTGNLNPSYDWTKANAAGAGMAAQGALWGAGIGAGIGTIIAPGLGTAIGGGIGLAVGAGGGYLLGMNNELTKQNEVMNNPMLWKEGADTPGEFKQWVMNTTDTPVAKAVLKLFPVVNTIAKMIQGKGFLQSIVEANNPLDIFSDSYAKKTGRIDEELLKIVEKTSADIKKIQQINQKNRKEMVASLRLQESVERLIKKISSGAYSRFEDMNVEGAQASNEILTSMGGSDAGYTANISRILDNATGSYTKNMEQINQKRKEILNAEGVNYASRINSANQLVKEQARVAKKWLDSILNSIGEYDKIPSVIQNSLKQKISEINLDSANKGLGMTSGIGYDLVNQNLQNSLDDASNATAQFLAEAKQVDQAMAAAAEQGKKAMERYQEIQKSGNGVSWLRDDMVDANGKINSSAMIENQNRIKEKKASVDKQVQQLTGISADQYVETMQHFDSLKSFQEGFDKTRSDVKNMDEEEFEGKKHEMLAGVIEDMEKTLAEIEATEKSSSSPILKQAASAVKSKVAGRIKRLQEMQNGDFSKKQMMGEIPADAVLAGSTTSSIEAIQKEAESNPEVKRILEEIGMANSLIQELASASDTSVAALKSQEKMIEKYQQQVERVRQQAEKLVSQIENDPSAVFWRKAQGVMEAAKDSMMETGDIAGYAAATIQNTANELSSMKDAAKKAEADLTEKRTALQGSAQQMIQEGGDSEKINGVLGMVNQLSNARLNYAQNQTEGNAEAVKAQEKALNNYVNNNFDKNNPEYQQILALISQSTALDEASLDALKKQKEIDSKNFQMFKTMISLMDGYKNTLDYMKASSQSKESDAGLRMAKKNLDARAAEQYGNEGIKAAKDQYQIAIKGIENAYKAGMKQLDKERAEIEGDTSLSPEEKRQKLEANMQKREALTSERNTQQLEARANIDDQIVKAAQTEYEAKKRTSELALEALDTESDFLQSVGAPMEMIIANERQRVALMQEQAVLARQNYEKMVASGASQEEQLKARNDAMKAENAAIKATFGAQRSMIEKMFGNMIGAFSEMDFIQGPGNAANHYGYGYYENQDGSVMRGGQGGNRGWSERVMGRLGNGGDFLYRNSSESSASEAIRKGTGGDFLYRNSSEPSARDLMRRGPKPGRGFGSYSSSTSAGTTSQSGKNLPGGKPGSPQAQLDQEKAESEQKARETEEVATLEQTNTQPEQSQSSVVEKPEISTVEVNRLDEVIAWEEKIAKILVETAKFSSENNLKDLKQKADSAFYDVEVAGGGGGGIFEGLHKALFMNRMFDKERGIEKRAEEAKKDNSEFSATLDELLIAPEKKPAPVNPEEQKPEEPPAESKPAEISAETKPELPPESNQKPDETSTNEQGKNGENAPATELVHKPEIRPVKVGPIPYGSPNEPEKTETPAAQEAPSDPQAKEREERRRELRRQQLRLRQEQLARESNKKGFFGSLWEGVKGTFTGEGFVNSYAGASEGYTPEEMRRMEEAEKMSVQTNPANPNGSNTPAYSVAQPVNEGERTTAPASEQNSTASAQTISVEVMVKFNNQMFEEAVKRVVVSSGTAKQITKSGMEAQNA